MALPFPISNGMEDLTKQQLFLAALLTSFVTSIATGIVTVSLMSQAPQTLTQTINQVVERTVEKVSAPAPATQAAAVVTTKQIIVTEDELVTAAIEKNTKSMVRISAEATTETPSHFVGLGVLVGTDGTLVADRNSYQPELSYAGLFSDGTMLPLAVVFTEEQSRIVIFKAVTDGKTKSSFSAVTMGDSDTLKLGQTVASLSGSDQSVAAVGTVSSIIARDDPTSTDATTTVKVRRTILATTAGSDGITGGPLIDTSGAVVGIKVGVTDPSYVPVNLIKKLLSDSIVFGAATSTTGTGVTPH